LPPAEGLGEHDRPTIGIDRGDGLPAGWVSRELDAISGNPFSGLFFLASMSQGRSRTESLYRTEAFNGIWDIGTGVLDFSPRSLPGGDEFEGDDFSQSTDDLVEHIETEGRRIRFGGTGGRPVVPEATRREADRERALRTPRATRARASGVGSRPR